MRISFKLGPFTTMSYCWELLLVFWKTGLKLPIFALSDILVIGGGWLVGVLFESKARQSFGWAVQ